MGSLDLNTPEAVQNKFKDREFDKTIVGYINNRMLASEHSMATNIKTWLENEAQYNAELIPTAEDKDRKRVAEDQPIYVPLRIPYTYAAVQTYLTYLLALFTKRRPMFQLLGRTTKDMPTAKEMEQVLHNNAINRGFVIQVHTWLRDAMIFNRGIMWRDWYKQTSKKVRVTQKQMLGVSVGEPIRELVETLEDEGNDIFASSPYDTYFDPGVTMQQIQEGEFVARVYYKTWTQVLSMMEQKKYWDVRDRIPKSSSVSWKNRGNAPRPGDSENDTTSYEHGRPAVEMIDKIIRLVPSEWKLGDSTFPEYWRIIVANGATVIWAEKLAIYEFPCYVIEPDFDGRTLHTKGIVSMMQPLQEVLSWLINSHMDSVRKSINNKLIIDPSMVEWDDVVKNKPYIRMSKRAQGKPASTAVHQLQMYDITKGHLQDLDVVTELLTRISAATENFMGIVNQGGRKTATEVRSANTLAGSRIEKTALVIGHQGWLPLTKGLVNGIQDNLTATMFYRDFLGEDPTKLLEIDPQRLKDGHFNYPPIDPTIPVDRQAIAAAWGDLIGIIGQSEGLGQTYDVGKMLGEWAELSGIKNLENFKIQAVTGQPGGPNASDGIPVPINTGNQSSQQ